MQFMKKKKILGVLLSICLCSGLLSGCNIANPLGTTMVDEEADTVESQTDMTGSWTVPGKDLTITFKEDGSFESSDGIKGSYSFQSSNSNFSLADYFENVEYLSCISDEDQSTYMTGAVLGDCISGFLEEDGVERYFVRTDREEVTADEIAGSWDDVYGDDYSVTFNEDGTLKEGKNEGSYTLEQNEDYGTTVTIKTDKTDSTYAIIPYEKYLFMYRVGSYAMYQLQPSEN